MTGYWIRHRAFLSIILSSVIAAIVGLLFAYPFITQISKNYNSQSVYRNSNIDFIAPEPSFEQTSELSGSNGIDKVFPFFLTKTDVHIGSRTRSSTVLLSDKFDCLDFTMYNSKRLIKESKSEYDNPILVDWQFCKDTSANIGDTVSFSIGDSTAEFRIYAIYETNSIYENGAILAQLKPEQKQSIIQKSQNNGYSGMYISASDYNACQSYLSTDYRPLGRLKERSQFDSDEQYKVHYEAIMASGYANEITDFRVMKNSHSKTANLIMIWIGAALSVTLLIAFNIAMSKRGSEKGYFSKHCIPKGQNVKPYYSKTFICEVLCFIIAYGAVLFYKLTSSSIYIPKSAYRIEILYIPAAILIAELICLIMNRIMIRRISKKK